MRERERESIYSTLDSAPVACSPIEVSGRLNPNTKRAEHWPGGTHEGAGSKCEEVGGIEGYLWSELVICTLS